MMRKVTRALAFVLAAGFAVGSYATDARVVVMGRQSTPWFYRDEVSVFTNPADMSLYPNMIYGSFGWVQENQRPDSYRLENMQPEDPFFGAMFSHRFSEDDNGAMLSIGAFVNRRDPMVSKLIKAGGTNKYELYAGETLNNLVEPLGKVDLMVGYDLGNGVAFGVGGYATVQNEQNNEVIVNQTEFFKGSFGLNWNVEQGLDFEAAVNTGVTNARFRDTSGVDSTVSAGEYFLRGDARIFSAVPAINGAFVPQVSLEYLKLNKKDIIDLNGGVGVNMYIDRGFFWAGVQGVYTHENAEGASSGERQSIGGRLSFGIERNIVWDWFLIRVGGQKEFRYVTEDRVTKWEENDPSDGSDNDLVGLGFGVNIDNRLRIDFVVSESLPYTLTNLISGNQSHLFNRVSATYRF